MGGCYWDRVKTHSCRKQASYQQEAELPSGSPESKRLEPAALDRVPVTRRAAGQGVLSEEATVNRGA